MLSDGKPVKFTATLTPLEPEPEEMTIEPVTVEPVPLSTAVLVSKLVLRAHCLSMTDSWCSGEWLRR